ncbi:MAG: hypothetical protein DHS20C20_10780 [Ardenticatenaceae bacterium]|nr:MAG: hypothetical protein DHS20C20_10780 [Ardenticatenaceae bacterium]
MQTITLQVPSKLASTAQAVAKQTKRPVEEILVEWLNNAAEHLPLESLADEQILALTQSMMESQQQEKLSSLLAKNRENLLNEADKAQLDKLMQLYRQSLLQKAEATKIAVDRGLIPPLS